MKRTTYLLVMLSACFVLVAFKQHSDRDLFTGDVKLFNERFATRKIGFTIDYNLYESYTAGKPLEIKSIRLSMWDKNMYMKMDDAEVINNDKYYLYADHGQKLIMIAKADKSNKKQPGFESQFMLLDTIMKGYFSEVKMIASTASSRTYHVKMQEDAGLYESADIMIDHKEKKLVKMTLFMKHAVNQIFKSDKTLSDKKAKPRLEVFFRDYETPVALNKQQFSVEKFITAGKQVTLKPAYAKYRLINNINATR